MLPTIENSEKFKTEYNSFKSRISEITNEKVKTELNGLLLLLLREVRNLDSQHQDIFINKELPASVTEIRSKIGDTRKSLLKRLEDWERINLKL